MIFDLDTRKNQDIRKILQTATEYAIRYLEGLDTRQVAPKKDAIAR
ncbi:hypothetical protein [Chlorogloeopsis sp. ULAP02]